MAARYQPFLTRSRLFDADRSDTEIEISSTTVGAIKDRQLLWLDVNFGGDPADRQALLAVLPFDTEVLERMWASASGPRL